MKTNEPALIYFAHGNAWQFHTALDEVLEVEFSRYAEALTAHIFSTAREPQAEVLRLPPASTAPTITISEVLANPAGREPAQEYIELFNFGDAPQSLADLFLQAVDSSSPLPGAMIPAHSHALLVGPNFDRRNAAQIAGGVTVIRLERWLSRGLSNEGFYLGLRDQEGLWLSRVEHPYPSPEQRCSIRPENVHPAALQVRYVAGESCTPGY